MLKNWSKIKKLVEKSKSMINLSCYMFAAVTETNSSDFPLDHRISGGLNFNEKYTWNQGK